MRQRQSDNRQIELCTKGTIISKIGQKPISIASSLSTSTSSSSSAAAAAAELL